MIPSLPAGRRQCLATRRPRGTFAMFAGRLTSSRASAASAGGRRADEGPHVDGPCRAVSISRTVRPAHEIAPLAASAGRQEAEFAAPRGNIFAGSARACADRPRRPETPPSRARYRGFFLLVVWTRPWRVGRSAIVEVLGGLDVSAS